MPHNQVAIVVPCYNEAERFDLGAFGRFLTSNDSVFFVLVNDGSSDDTLTVLHTLAEGYSDRVMILDLQPNKGKAEAVRLGLLAACERAEIVGFWDADLATPLDVVPQLVSILHSRPQIQWVLGSRVKLLGRNIDRNELRHYLGRVFATGASITLKLGVYDTQCGAKLFRVTPLLRQLLQTPFVTRWVFDVELIARLIQASRQLGAPDPKEILFEAPLNQWRDVAGSKVRPTDFLRSGGELARIWWRYLRKSRPHGNRLT